MLDDLREFVRAAEGRAKLQRSNGVKSWGMLLGLAPYAWSKLDQIVEL